MVESQPISPLFVEYVEPGVYFTVGGDVVEVREAQDIADDTALYFYVAPQ